MKIGGGGPIPISNAELIDEVKRFKSRFTKAWKSTGRPMTENIYDGEMNGFAHCCDMICRDQRSVHSKRLIIDETDKSCKGVTVFDPSRKELNLYFTRSHSLLAKLLMPSGIGLNHDISKHRIITIVDSEHVGQHLLNYPGAPIVFQVKDGYGMENHLLRKGPGHTATVNAYKNGNKGSIGSGLLKMICFQRIDFYLEKDPAYVAAKKANGGADPFSPLGQPHFELYFVSIFITAFQWHFMTPRKGQHTCVVVDLARPVSDPSEVTLNSANS
ncbi:hypothetical protein N7448_009661 [Penicillium atrosanguineum]|uniref:uncharacterized protein n=1 Tax=Penicillium atrosanguineum TaxID=1132637 RepID=UPI002393A887|nr:uncharacterized protein N7443_006908 [Penicillium atrosanguineum]KAJ5123564.1 hypothetical protein N7448_009661 [Penicillium atrosanguineum]KAJ5142192.1 hypothetical protein N7526_003187 [Penicillium atrosanguineum]KAJ5298788.1 hypothetical protein N7443_006908 [Penicillium atrosanguineum]